MTSVQDASIGISVAESTYGTAVVTTRWFEFLSETLDYRKNVKQGAGLRVGGRIARDARRTVPTHDGGGDVVMECCSKGMGLWWQFLVGAGTSTLVSAATYQQNFVDSDTAGSVTIQKGLPEASGTVDAYTFSGAMCSQWELDFTQSDIVTLKATIDAQNPVSSIGYAEPSYPAAPVNLFTFAGGSIYSGAFTAPTTTAVAIGATPLADVHGGTIVVNNNMKVDRYNLGNAGLKSKPTPGLGAITGSLDIEYDNTTFAAAVMADTPMSLVLTWTAGALGVGLETLQVAIPNIRFDGTLPLSNGTDLIIQAMKFTGLDNLTNDKGGIYVSCRTADIAL
jgi:hypothetical protein